MCLSQTDVTLPFIHLCHSHKPDQRVSDKHVFQRFWSHQRGILVGSAAAVQESNNSPSFFVIAGMPTSSMKHLSRSSLSKSFNWQVQGDLNDKS